MAAPTFSPLPTPPNRDQSPNTFAADADAFLGALPQFQTDGNTIAAYCETQAGAALGHANDAAASAALGQSDVTVYTDQATFDAVTPADNTLHILVLS